MKGGVKNLETKIPDALVMKRFRGRKTMLPRSQQSYQGFKNEENERRKVYDELTMMKDDIKAMRMGRNCSVSSAASTGFGLGSGTFARPPPLGPKWKDIF